MTLVEIFEGKPELKKAMATQLLELIRKTPRDQFNLAVTGGGLGIELLAEIAGHPDRDLVDWSTVNIFFSDERFVPAASPDRNQLQATQALLDAIDCNVFGFPASDDLSLEPARASFEKTLLEHFDSAADVVFDLILLGIGPDGHIASLFPGFSYPPEQAVVSVSDSPKPPAQRLSLNYWVINQAKRVWFLASGSEKRLVVNSALSGERDYPVGKISAREETKFFITADVT